MWCHSLQHLFLQKRLLHHHYYFLNFLLKLRTSDIFDMFSKAFLIGSVLAGFADGRSFLAADVFSNADSCAAGGAVQGSVLKEVGVCLDLPSGLPPPLNAVKSYKIGSCTNGATSVDVEIDTFTKSGCAGIKIPYTIKDKIPTTCANNTKISCQSAPQALSEAWPAVGLYLNDATCAKAGGVLAVRPTCAGVNGGDKGDYSLEMKCNSPSEIQLITYNETATCSGGVVSYDGKFVAGACTLVGEIPIPPHVSSMLDSSLMDVFMAYPFGMDAVNDVVLTGYYKAGCSGF